MEFLYWLENLRTPFLDNLFSLLTHLGSEVAFLVVAIVTYWCVSKARGMYLLGVGCLGTCLNQFLKLACRVPRPWVKDPAFTIVESARADAGGYSFPSGHTQNAVGTFGCLAMDARRGWKVFWILLAVITAFSRMYLGVHTPADVLVSAGLALALVFALRPVVEILEKRPVCGLWLLAGLLAVNGLYLIYVNLWQFPADVDRVNLTHGTENAFKLFGALLGMTAGYAIDLNWIKFRTEATPLGQVLKCVLGLVLLLGLKEGLKPILGSSMGADLLRYAFVTLFASGIWPITFTIWENIGRKKETK